MILKFMFNITLIPILLFIPGRLGKSFSTDVIVNNTNNYIPSDLTSTKEVNTFTRPFPERKDTSKQPFNKIESYSVSDQTLGIYQDKNEIATSINSSGKEVKGHLSNDSEVSELSNVSQDHNWYPQGSNRTDASVQNISREITKVDLNDFYIDEDNNNLTSDFPAKDLDIPFDPRAREDAFTITTPAMNPYLVFVALYSEKHKLMGYCTGNMLTNQWVLTAGHCVVSKGLDHILLYAGGNSLIELDSGKYAQGSQLIRSTEWRAHPGYKKSNEMEFDISLIKASVQFNYSTTVRAISLSVDPWNFHSYRSCQFTGFGKVKLKDTSSEDGVRKTQMLQVKNPCKCAFYLRAMTSQRTVRRLICTKPQEDYGVCPGDSGGGLICDGKLWAVASFGIVFNHKTCDMEILSSMKCGGIDTLSAFVTVCPRDRVPSLEVDQPVRDLVEGQPEHIERLPPSGKREKQRRFTGATLSSCGFCGTKYCANCVVVP